VLPADSVEDTLAEPVIVVLPAANVEDTLAKPVIVVFPREAELDVIVELTELLPTNRAEVFAITLAPT
jgi:hypothetical protein